MWSGWTETKEHALTVLWVADAVVHQVPIHTVGATISRVTAVARLPILEAESRVVEGAFARIGWRFDTVGVICDVVNLLVGNVYNIQCIREIGGQIELAILQRHIARSVALDG